MSLEGVHDVHITEGSVNGIRFEKIVTETLLPIFNGTNTRSVVVMHLSMASPTPPPPRVGWGNSGDLTEYHVKNPSPGALPDVNAPIYCQESIGD